MELRTQVFAFLSPNPKAGSLERMGGSVSDYSEYDKDTECHEPPMKQSEIFLHTSNLCLFLLFVQLVGLML